jgi:hypothetical protein
LKARLQFVAIHPMARLALARNCFTVILTGREQFRLIPDDAKPEP